MQINEIKPFWFHADFNLSFRFGIFAFIWAMCLIFWRIRAIAWISMQIKSSYERKAQITNNTQRGSVWFVNLILSILTTTKKERKKHKYIKKIYLFIFIDGVSQLIKLRSRHKTTPRMLQTERTNTAKQNKTKTKKYVVGNANEFIIINKEPTIETGFSAVVSASVQLNEFLFSLSVRLLWTH